MTGRGEGRNGEERRGKERKGEKEQRGKGGVGEKVWNCPYIERIIHTGQV
jgi:hypothetical protein